MHIAAGGDSLRPIHRTKDFFPMKLRISTFVLAVLAVAGSATQTLAVAVPILDPGFDIYLGANPITPEVTVPDDRIPNVATPGAGTGPHNDFQVLVYDTFAVAPEAGGRGHTPAGWTATGKKPNQTTANTGRARCDACFHTGAEFPGVAAQGTVASINSNGSQQYEDPAHPGTFISTPGIFFQNLVNPLTSQPVSALPNTLYTATIVVMDIDIMGRGPFAPSEDDSILGDPGTVGDTTGTSKIRLNLSVGATNLGGTLEFTDIPGFPNFGTPTARNSAGRMLLTLTTLTGATVPEGQLTISFTSGGVFGTLPATFAPSAATAFDNITLDATPIAPPGVPGDYNNNGVVDAADYVLWRKGGPLQNQVDDPNTVNNLDYTAWRARFGNNSGSGSGAGLGSALVPEPTGIITVLTGGLLAMGGARLPKRRADRYSE
jgi:hypothetical protein